MKVHSLHKLEGTRTWEWRTEDNQGLYYTYSDGTAIHFFRNDQQWHHKVSSCEKFKVCKTASGTRKKLNRMFATKIADPTEENPWRF